MNRWVDTVIAHRKRILAAWVVLFLLGGAAAANLGGLLSNRFSVPGAESERGLQLIQKHMGDRSDGSFTLVATGVGSPAERAEVQSVAQKAAAAVPHAKAGPILVAGKDVVYVQISTPLENADASKVTPDLRNAIGHPAGIQTYVSGYPAINHDTQKIFNKDLGRGESLAIPIALLVMAFMFGTVGGIAVPVIFAAITIPTTLGFVWIFAHTMDMAIYVTNIVALIGLAIAVDYSMLVVFRFREELARTPDDVHRALQTTMATAGRATLFSGLTVAIGLALLVFMPLPFMRSMGVGGFLIPIVSIAAAATLQPALLAIYGRRGTHRLPVAAFLRDRVHLPIHAAEHPDDVEHRFWARLAVSIMRRKWRYLAVVTALLVAAAIPVGWLQLTPGATAGIPQSPQSVRGLRVLEAALGPGAIAPAEVLVDSGRPAGVRGPSIQAAIARLIGELGRDGEVSATYYLPGGRFVDPSARYAQVIVATRHEYGSEEAQSFARRLRSRLIPAAGFPLGTVVRAGGAPPQGVDFLSRAYGAFPWLVLGVLALTYLLLMRAFRSMLLPLKAVALNLLSVAASYGALVLVFRVGVGKDVLGLYQFPQIEGWIPIFLFAMLFGLSMDYEVFLVSRMREAWDETHDNTRAVAVGLERTGRIITAAAVIMVAAFSGFMAGSIVGLQEFGCGLAVAIFFDATLVRAVLVPSMMAILGRYNWWLPARVARLVRVRPSPLETAPAPAGGSPR
jgi:RND superfamily putative drug exporter